MTQKLSIILTACNEAESLERLLPKLVALYKEAEIIVVNDGSEDTTIQVCERYNVKVVSHPYKMGNGAAIKTGARVGKGDIFVFMDADGQHDPDEINLLLEKMQNNYAMVVGARSLNDHASSLRKVANYLYNKLASFMTGWKIMDLTSGFRAVRSAHFKRFLYLLPNGFSYPTTITMAFFRSGLPVTYVSIKAGQRQGKSHINIIKDGMRFFVIILKVGALFSPMRLFLPVSFLLFVIGLCYYGYTYLLFSRLTNMTVMLILSSLFTFLIGILSELVSSLHYRGVEESLYKHPDSKS